MDDKTLLHRLYYDNHNYDGINQLYNKAKEINPKISRDFVSKWLNKQDSYQQTFKKVGENIYLPIYSEIPYSFQIDLTFFPKYTSKNGGNVLLFTAINVNTRYAYAYYAKNKDMKTITGFLIDMEKQTPINSITCDEGKEFKNKEFINFCNEKKIMLYFVKSDSRKLGIINRFHRTIKDKLTKHFISTDSVNWVNVIDDIVRNYNNTINRGIGMKPSKINNAMEVDIINEKREESKKIKNAILPKFEVGDVVRILRKKKTFEDKQLARFSDKLYKVVKVMMNSLDVKNDDEVKRVKITDVRKVQQSGEILPNIPVTEIEKVNKEATQKRRIRREGLDTTNIISDSRRRKLK